MNGTLVAAQVESVSTRRDRTLKVVFGLQEVSASKGAELLSLQDKVVALYISAKDSGSCLLTEKCSTCFCDTGL